METDIKIDTFLETSWGTFLDPEIRKYYKMSTENPLPLGKLHK